MGISVPLYYRDKVSLFKMSDKHITSDKVRLRDRRIELLQPLCKNGDLTTDLIPCDY